MDEKEVKKLIKQESKSSFAQKRVGDTPTDALQLVNRKYVTLNGTLATRPASVLAIVGQSFYATDINVPLVYDGTKWRNGVGSVIASN